MPNFAWKARATDGALREGVLEAADSGVVADVLVRDGLIPLNIKPTQAAVRAVESGESWGQNLFAPKVSALDVQLFSRQMYTLLKAGVPIMRALGGLYESAINPTFGKVILKIRESLDSGRELSASLAQHPAAFSPFYLSMVRVGELTGRLEEIFLRLFDHMEFERDMRAKVKSALRYPVFVVIAMVLAIAVINLFVIPAFAKVYAGFNAELPLMTRLLIGSSNFFVANWPYMLGLLVAAIFGARAYVRTTAGRYSWDRWKLKFPIAGKIMLKATLSRFARSFALASRSGVPVMQSLNVVADVVENTYIAQQIRDMRSGVERGESVLRVAIASGVFTPIVLQMIAVGEETGALDDLMQEIAEMYEREVDYELKTLSSQIEPILIVGLGILVLILALGVFLPIWDLGQVAMKK